jgi:hypothetical protein
MKRVQQDDLRNESTAKKRENANHSFMTQVKKFLSHYVSKENRTLLLGVFLLSFGLAIPFLYILLTRLGIGSSFPFQQEYYEMKPLFPESSLEIVGILPFPPGNIAVLSSRIFFTFHPEFRPPVNVAELSLSSSSPSTASSSSSSNSGSSRSDWKPFPSLSFQQEFQSVLSLRIDPKMSRLWLLDYCHHAIQYPPKLFAFHLATAASSSLSSKR